VDAPHIRSLFTVLRIGIDIGWNGRVITARVQDIAGSLPNGPVDNENPGQAFVKSSRLRGLEGLVPRHQGAIWADGPCHVFLSQRVSHDDLDDRSAGIDLIEMAQQDDRMELGERLARIHRDDRDTGRAQLDDPDARGDNPAVS
jgi:hypothetical protein